MLKYAKMCALFSEFTKPGFLQARTFVHDFSIEHRWLHKCNMLSSQRATALAATQADRLQRVINKGHNHEKSSGLLKSRLFEFTKKTVSIFQHDLACKMLLDYAELY